MIVLLVILGVMIAAADTIRLTLMKRKMSLLWCIVWIAAAYFSTIWLAGLSTQEALESLNIKGICTLGCIETIIFLSYLFYAGKGCHLLSYYPGFMMAVPIVLLAFWMSRTVRGVDFNTIGIMTAGMVAVFIMGGTFCLHRLKCDKHWLYTASILDLILYILVYGIL